MADARAAFERLIANPDITIYGIMVLARLANFLDGHAAMRPERARKRWHTGAATLPSAVPIPLAEDAGPAAPAASAMIGNGSTVSLVAAPPNL